MQTYKTEDTGWLQAFRKKKKRALQFLNGSWKAFCLPILCEIIHSWRLFCLLTLLHLRCLSRCQKHDRTPAPRSRWSGALTQCVYPTPLAAPWAVNNDTGGSLTFNSLQVGGTFSNSRFTQTLMDFTTIQKNKCLVSFTGTEKNDTFTCWGWRTECTSPEIRTGYKNDNKNIYLCTTSC